MNTLVVRSLTPTDIVSLRGLLGYNTLLGMQRGGSSDPASFGSHLVSTMPVFRGRNRVFVAQLDGKVCATVTARPQTHRYRWDILSLSAAPQLLEQSDKDCNAVWTALLEFAIHQAGRSGAKRLFASADEDSAAFHGLRSASFEPYSRFWIVRGTVPVDAPPRPDGFRRQEESDVWSIHQLYHLVTPAGVQYEEALTSAAWELQHPSALGRLISHLPTSDAYVVETIDGIVAHCALEYVRGEYVARLLVEDRYRHLAYQLALSAAHRAGMGKGSALSVVVPGYSSELLRQFEAESFRVETERVALIRHTTAPARIQSRAVTPLADVPERVPRGVPTYYHRMEKTSAAVPAARRCRMERIAS